MESKEKAIERVLDMLTWGPDRFIRYTILEEVFPQMTESEVRVSMRRIASALALYRVFVAARYPISARTTLQYARARRNKAAHYSTLN